MSEATCHRCGTTIDTESDAYYQRVPPETAPDTTAPLFFCSPWCVYEYTGEQID